MVTLVWSSEALFKSFQQRLGQGQVKKGLNVDKKGIYLDQFWLRNLMVLFFSTTPRSYKNRICKNDVIIGYDYGDKNTPFGGQKLSYWLEILYTGRRLVAE